MTDKPKSVFDNHEFVNGFIDFYESEQFERYMVPFLHELIEICRDRLETTENPKHFQDRLGAIRMIAEKANSLKLNKRAKAEADDGG
jgi:hypothetical protein